MILLEEYLLLGYLVSDTVEWIFVCSFLLLAQQSSLDSLSQMPGSVTSCWKAHFDSFCHRRLFFVISKFKTNYFAFRQHGKASQG